MKLDTFMKITTYGMLSKGNTTMTNKDYKPLTTGGYANSKMLQEYRDRLCYLEDCIKNKTLLFLPCKVGDKVWHIQHNLTIEEAVVDNVEVLCDGDTNIRVHFVNIQAGTTFRGNTMGRVLFTTKEAAEEALEEMNKGGRVIMCEDTKLYIVSSNGDFSSTIIVGSVMKKDFEELQYTLSKSFDRHGMDLKEVAMDLIVAGYGKASELQQQCDKLTDDNKALQSNLDLYVLEVLSLKRKLEELETDRT